MGKKKIDKIQLIKNEGIRKVTFCKRKKGLLKKCIELSVLCDLKMFVFMYDHEDNRVVHYASDAQQDFFALFNKQSQREYYSNRDYIRVGGKKDEYDLSESQSIDGDHEDEQIIENGDSP